MRKKVILYLFIIIEIFMITGCHKKDIVNKEDKNLEDEIHVDNDKIVDETDLYGGRNGTADLIEGKTLIVSIYTDDKTTSWNLLNEIDEENMYDSIDNLEIATKWLEKQVNSYNKEAKFIFDWRKYSDLRYTAEFNDISFKDNYYGDYYKQTMWIIENIDILKLKKKYRYDNIIFIFLFNMQSVDDEYPRSNAYNNEWNLDIINLFVQNNIYYTTSAVYVHEILHLFGVPDLYQVNNKINQEYVDYVNEYRYDDIMNNTSKTKEVKNIFSLLDAYYAGLINECDEVSKWNLGKSDHLIN